MLHSIAPIAHLQACCTRLLYCRMHQCTKQPTRGHDKEQYGQSTNQNLANHWHHHCLAMCAHSLTVHACNGRVGMPTASCSAASRQASRGSGCLVWWSSCAKCSPIGRWSTASLSPMMDLTTGSVHWHAMQFDLTEYGTCSSERRPTVCMHHKRMLMVCSCVPALCCAQLRCI